MCHNYFELFYVRQVFFLSVFNFFFFLYEIVKEHLVFLGSTTQSIIFKNVFRFGPLFGLFVVNNEHVSPHPIKYKSQGSREEPSAG